MKNLLIEVKRTSEVTWQVWTKTPERNSFVFAKVYYHKRLDGKSYEVNYGLSGKSVWYDYLDTAMLGIFKRITRQKIIE